MKYYIYYIVFGVIPFFVMQRNCSLAFVVTVSQFCTSDWRSCCGLYAAKHALTPQCVIEIETELISITLHI